MTHQPPITVHGPTVFCLSCEPITAQNSDDWCIGQPMECCKRSYVTWWGGVIVAMVIQTETLDLLAAVTHRFSSVLHFIVTVQHRENHEAAFEKRKCWFQLWRWLLITEEGSIYPRCTFVGFSNIQLEKIDKRIFIFFVFLLSNLVWMKILIQAVLGLQHLFLANKYPNIKCCLFLCIQFILLGRNNTQTF